MSSFDSNSDFGALNSRKRDTRMGSSRSRNMSSRRKYQNGSRYRSKRSGRNSDFHWGYVAVPAVIGVAGVTTLAIVLSKNKSKSGKDGAKGEPGASSGSPSASGGSGSSASGSKDPEDPVDPEDKTLFAMYKKKVMADARTKVMVEKEYGLRYKTKGGVDASGKAVDEKGFKYTQDSAGRKRAEKAVFARIQGNKPRDTNPVTTDNDIYTAETIRDYEVTADTLRGIRDTARWSVGIKEGGKYALNFLNASGELLIDGGVFICDMIAIGAI